MELKEKLKRYNNLGFAGAIFFLVGSSLILVLGLIPSKNPEYWHMAIVAVSLSFGAWAGSVVALHKFYHREFKEGWPSTGDLFTEEVDNENE